MVMITGAVIAIGIVQILCVLGLFWGLVELRAMQKSTHSVQFVPADQSFQRMTDEVKEALGKDLFDNVG
jgi:hypothetical protein